MKKKKIKSSSYTPEVEKTYTTEITFICPVRGKVTQKVTATRYKSQKSPDKQVNYEYDFLKDEEDEEDAEEVPF